MTFDSSLSTSTRVLVTGATGKQGGAVVKALLALPTPPSIRALSRNTTSPAAVQLANKGIEVVKGSLDDQQSLEEALKGVDAAFLVTSLPADKTSPSELLQANTFLSAALSTRLPFLVFSSVNSATPDCNIPRFESKAHIELLIKESKIPHCIVAPSSFYENWPKKSGMKSAAILGLYAAAIGEEKEMKMNSVDDIGFFAAAALTSPSTYTNRTLQLAGDSLSVSAIRATYARVEGKRVGQWWIPKFLVELLPKEIKGMVRFDCKADLEELRRENHGLKSFEMWLREGGKEE